MTVEAKCHVCESKVGVKYQLVEFFSSTEVMITCSDHFDVWSFSKQYSMEASTFDTLEEAQVALIKRSL